MASALPSTTPTRSCGNGKRRPRFPDPNSPQKVSAVQKLKDSLVNLQEENDRMRREIERGGGDLWSADDRPKDIARIIVDKLTKAKAERVAREILNALKETNRS